MAKTQTVLLLQDHPFIRTPYNRSRHKRDHETNIYPSMTIPDQSLTISELIQRFHKGLDLGGGRVPFYQGDENLEFDALLPDARRMDLTEIQDELEEIASRYAQRKFDERKKAEDDRKKSDDERIEQIVQARLKEKESQNQK